MRDDNSRDQHLAVGSFLPRMGNFFLCFIGLSRPQHPKLRNRRQPLASYPPSDWWPNASGRVVDNTKKVPSFENCLSYQSAKIFKDDLTNSSSQPSRTSILHEIIYCTLFCGLGKRLEWVQCPRVQVGTKGWPFWAFRIPNSLRIGHLRRLCSLPMIGSLQCSKLPWPGHDFQSWKLCSALSISKESFSLYLYIVTLGVLNTNDWVLQEEPHGLYICWCVFSFNRLLKMCGYHFNSFPAVWIFKG